MVYVKDAVVTMRPQGEFGIYNVEEALTLLKSLLEEINVVSVDMSETNKLDTAGFQLLASLKKSCDRSGKRFEISGVNDSIQKFLELFGFDETFCEKARIC